ncbi:MAG: hypothetical protein DYG98_22475 [Haliscomenobacteraceae bacterium CHB4]|nr:hypothetical protein [Saprospiraceae bacterium]MCE7925826.1 hypothetical protein [Haliscomenobacteraceae bacterium CHB4]
MGADNPQTGKPDTKTPTPFPLILIGLALFLAGIVLFFKMDFEDDRRAPKLPPKEEEKLTKRLREIDDSEQYALLAETDGWYPCLHSGKSIFYLKAGEVWKYGVTSKGKLGRYRTDFLIRNNVSYFVQYNGTLSECLKQEQIKLFNYPYLPENLARPRSEQLPRPPFNPIMR